MLDLNVCGLEKQAATLHQINLKLFKDYFFKNQTWSRYLKIRFDVTIRENILL